MFFVDDLYRTSYGNNVNAQNQNDLDRKANIIQTRQAG